MTRLDRWVAALLGAAALLLYAARLEHTPIYLHDAEILFGLQAHAVATTGHDVSGRLLPLYFQMRPIGENVWFHPVIVYVTAFFLTVIPFSESAVRLPSACVGALDVALLYVLARQIFERRREAVLAATLLALTPAHFIHSRIAMDYIYPVPFVLGWTVGLLAFLKHRRLWMLAAATSLLGIGVYSYIASVVMMPLYLAFTIVALWRASALSRRTLVAALGGFVWPLLALPIWLAFHAAVVSETLERYRIGRTVTRFTSVTGRMSMFWYFWDPVYLFVSGGYANVMNSTRHVGVFVLPLVVMVVAGIRRLARRGRSIADGLVLAGFFSAPFAACLAVPEPYAIDREMALLPFGILIAVWGVRELMEARRTVWPRVATTALALVPLHFAFFYVDYFTDYRRHSAIWFELNHRGAMERLVAMSPRESSTPPRILLPADKDPYMDAYWQFTLAKLDRGDLRDRTELYKSGELASMSIPRGSLVLMRQGDAPVEALVASGALRQRAIIEELADPPEFIVLER